jgi:hypothetical protein
MDGDESMVDPSKGADESSSLSWSDRKKRDRLREKELLLSMKYVFNLTLLCAGHVFFSP